MQLFTVYQYFIQLFICPNTHQYRKANLLRSCRCINSLVHGSRIDRENTHNDTTEGNRREELDEFHSQSHDAKFNHQKDRGVNPKVMRHHPRQTRIFMHFLSPNCRLRHDIQLKRRHIQQGHKFRSPVSSRSPFCK